MTTRGRCRWLVAHIIEERYCEIAAKRLAQGVLALGDDPPGSRDREEGT